MWMIHSLLQFFFPSQCLGCGKNKSAVCARCLKLARKSLGVPAPHVISIFDFKDPLIKQAIHAMKYHHRKDLFSPLSIPLSEELRKITSIETYVLIPIPMPSIRKLFRGYNQAEEIARELSYALQIEIRTDILLRSKNPTRQVKARTRKERLDNQTDSFLLAGKIEGMNVLLVDDVTTTGATLEEARKVLLKGRARQVLAATLAH
jgi:competence protein ComFC